MAIYLSRKKGGTVATPITPSNSSPAQMTANVAVNPTANGYAIASYDSVTPSSTPTSVSANDVVKIGGSGVIVDSIQNCKVGTATLSSNTSTTIELGFTPKYICTRHGFSNTTFFINVYNEDVRSGYSIFGGTSANLSWTAFPTTDTNRLNSLTSTGFVFNKVSAGATTLSYFAIG